MPDATRKSRKEAVGASAAGAGSGTLLVAFAGTLKDGNPLKYWIPLLAPSVSVTVGVIWLWCQTEIANYVQSRKIAALVLRTRELLERGMKNPSTTDKHRQAIRRRYEELELLLADRDLHTIKSLVPLTTEDVQRMQEMVERGAQTPAQH